MSSDNPIVVNQGVAFPRPRPWRRGQKITAKELTKDRELLGRFMDRVDSPRQVRRLVSAAIPEVGQFRIVGVGDNVIVCNEFDGETQGTATFHIAKPWDLRRAPFDGLYRNDIYYTYTDGSTRTADNGTDTEDQVIVPSYSVGDVIFAIKGISRGVGSLGSSEAVWLDLNVAGRAWAKASE